MFQRWSHSRRNFLNLNLCFLFTNFRTELRQSVHLLNLVSSVQGHKLLESGQLKPDVGGVHRATPIHIHLRTIYPINCPMKHGEELHTEITAEDHNDPDQVFIRMKLQNRLLI